MVAVIRLIPRVCDETGVKDIEKCKELLNYCNPNDNQDVCHLKIIGKAIANPENITDIKAGLGHLYHGGESGLGDIHDFVASRAHEVYEGTAEWYAIYGDHPVIHAAGESVGIIGHVVSWLIGG